MFQIIPQNILLKQSGAIEKLAGSSISFLISELYKQVEDPLFVITANKERAKHIFSDLTVLLDEEKHLFFIPGTSKISTDDLLYTDAMEGLSKKEVRPIYVTHLKGFLEKIIVPQSYESHRLKLTCQEEINLDELVETLFDLSFRQVPRVIEPGDFALRGQILDVFSFSHPQPFRITFSGDVIESIRRIDLESQLSVKNFKATTIVPDIQKLDSPKTNWLKAVPSNTRFILVEGTHLNATAEKQELLDETDTHISWNLIKAEFNLQSLLELNSHSFFEDYSSVIDTSPQPAFQKNFKLLKEDLLIHQNKGYQCTICCSNAKQELRIKEILDTYNLTCQTKVLPIQEGFINHTTKSLFYTDSQIFERYQTPRSKTGYTKAQQLSSKDFTELDAGDYIVHIDHGIGKYAGLQKIEVNGTYQEVIKLIYANNDIVYVSIHMLHKVSKYRHKDGEPPTLNKLGSKKWDNLKTKTKKRVKEIAYDLLKVYAKRKVSKGHAFGQDTLSQKELEASFFYEDTEDQWEATEAVKKDMESDLPMDRLICGDVGFGKTEIAIRAVFKSIDNGKQAAVMVPTTILAFQHYQTFTERLKSFPIRIAYLSRSVSTQKRKEILNDLASGGIDVIIGTHILAGEQIRFKDLGLLVIDEEQKFGVGVKDKLKAMKENIDTLTLSATPIPRTLQFSLTGVRDMSILRTPPANRHPIKTKVIQFNKTIIKEAIDKELKRNGQVLFVYNRVAQIKDMEVALRSILPSARIAIGHGQMASGQLEKIMIDFINHEYDILLATTIIENGLDVPNANTMFVYNAHLFGLSELHQMRGRVGRSNKQASCFFIVPELKSLSDTAQKRIKVVEEFSSLGAGFNIAMKDLELRGTGDLLGGEQSGFINEIGFETYQQILAETVEELKEETTNTDEKPKATLEEESFVKECVLETDLELLIPNSYINNTTERLKIYQEINQIKSKQELEQLSAELEDRFGPIPDESTALLLWIETRCIAEQLGFEKIVLKNTIFLGIFSTNKASRLYKSPIFVSILDFIQTHPERTKISEKKSGTESKLILKSSNISSIQDLHSLLNQIHDYVYHQKTTSN